MLLRRRRAEAPCLSLLAVGVLVAAALCSTSERGSVCGPARKEGRILTVGDGNFGFSVALLARLNRMPGTYHLTATSFDSRETVLAKYPEARPLLARLADSRRVTVVHGVDACDLAGSARTAREVRETGPFDLIIFNFPHAGMEDFRRHRALLAHFFDSAKQQLAPGGQVQVALANEQPRDWAIVEMAGLAGLEVLEARSFNAELEFPGYTLRRHTNGKSFKTRQNHRFTFVCSQGRGERDDPEGNGQSARQAVNHSDSHG